VLGLSKVSIVAVNVVFAILDDDIVHGVVVTIVNVVRKLNKEAAAVVVVGCVAAQDTDVVDFGEQWCAY
jgi:hypothetical protein